MGRIKANTALVLWGVVTLVGNALHFREFLHVYALWLEVLFGELLLLLYNLLQLQLNLADLYQNTHLQRMLLALPQHPPQRFVI
jgi:hypothetical protein